MEIAMKDNVLSLLDKVQRDHSLTKEKRALIFSDIGYGLEPEDIKEYAFEKYTLRKMIVISSCLKDKRRKKIIPYIKNYSEDFCEAAVSRFDAGVSEVEIAKTLANSKTPEEFLEKLGLEKEEVNMNLKRSNANHDFTDIRQNQEEIKSLLTTLVRIGVEERENKPIDETDVDLCEVSEDKEDNEDNEELVPDYVIEQHKTSTLVVECTKKKHLGFVGNITRSRSRNKLFKNIIKNRLSKEQLEQISIGIKSGLSGKQLGSIIDPNIEPEVMAASIEIAKALNKAIPNDVDDDKEKKIIWQN